jgi:pimeloyl-ACP methyl ester carboxylesterase
MSHTEREEAGAPLRRRLLQVDGIGWRYVVNERDAPALLLLTGALGEADFGSELMTRLAREFRIVAPDYPPIGELDALIRGLAAILDAEGIVAAHVLGGSFGGLVAQAFARQRPEQVRSLILSHTGAPRRVRGGQVAVALLKVIPSRLLRSLFRRRVRPAVTQAGPEWIERFEAVLARIGRREIVARMSIALDAHRHCAEAMPDADRPTLIIHSDDDPLISAADLAALRALYPLAAVRTFHGTGHLTALLRPDAFAGAVAGFIREQQPQNTHPDQPPVPPRG